MTLHKKSTKLEGLVSTLNSLMSMQHRTHNFTLAHSTTICGWMCTLMKSMEFA